MDKPQKTIKFWQGPLPVSQNGSMRNPSSKDHLDAIRVIHQSPNSRLKYNQYYTDQKMSPAIVKRGNDYQNISLTGTTDDKFMTDKDSHILRSKDDRMSLPKQVYTNGSYTDDKPQSQSIVQRHRERQAQIDQSLPKINMSPQKSTPSKWVGAKSSELSQVMENHKKVMRNLDQVWGYPKQGNISYNYLNDTGDTHNMHSNTNSQKGSLRQLPPNIQTGTEYSDQYLRQNGNKRHENRSIEMEKGKGYTAAIGMKQQAFHQGIITSQKANQHQIKQMVRNTIQNSRKKASFGSIQSPNEPYSGTTGDTGAVKDAHKSSIQSGLTNSNGQIKNNVYIPGQNGNMTPVNNKNSIFSNSAPRGNSKLKSVSRLDGVAHLTMGEYQTNHVNFKRRLGKQKPQANARANDTVQQTVFYNNRAAATTQFSHEPTRSTILKGEKNKTMKKILAAQQKNERKLITKRGLLNKEEAQEYLTIKDYLKPLKPNKQSSSTHKERPGDVLYAAPQKKMMDQYYAMQQNDQNFKKLMDSQGLPDSTVEQMFKIRRNTTQNTIANMKKAQELRIQNIQIVEQMNLKSAKKNQIPTITQDLEHSVSGTDVKRNLNKSSLSNNQKQVSSQKKQILSLQKSLRNSKKLPESLVVAQYNESTGKVQKSVKFKQGKESAKRRKQPPGPHKVRFKTDDAIDEKDHLFDKYVKKALEDEVASVNNINQKKSAKNNMEQMSQMLFEIKSFGKVSEKLTPRLGNRVKFVDANMQGRILRSREKSQRRREYSEIQRQKLLDAERESRRRESEKDFGSNKSPNDPNSRISMYSRAHSRQSKRSQIGEVALAQKKLIKKSYNNVAPDSRSQWTRNTKIDLQSHRSVASRYNSSVRSRKLIAGSGMRHMSPDVVERLTGDHICGKSLCSANHNPTFLKLAKISERKPYKSLKKKGSKNSLGKRSSSKKSFRDRSASPFKNSTNTEGSIQAVNIDLLKKEMMEAGCDPIDFDELNRSDEDGAGGSPGWRKMMKIKLDEDWSKSIIMEAVQEIHYLYQNKDQSLQERDKKQQQIEDRILNIRSKDIFNEEESKYNYSILRKMTSNINIVDPYDKDQVKEMYRKAKRTVEVLSDILMLSTEDLTGTIEKEGPGLEQMLNAGMSPEDKKRSSSNKKSVILLDGSYNTLNSNNVVKLMLRCVKLYTALHDVKQILLMILKSEDMYYDTQTGILKTVVEKYESQSGLKLTQEDEGTVIKVLQFFKKISRRVCTFQQDHRLFRIFKFRDQELQKTILKRAKKLGQFLMDKDGEQEQFKYPVLDVSRQLDFVNLSSENPKANISTTVEKEGGIESTMDEIKIQDELQLKTQQSDFNLEKDMQSSIELEQRVQKGQQRNEQTLQTKESEVLFKTNILNTAQDFPYEDKSSNNNNITNRISMEQIVTTNKFEPQSSQMTFQMKQTNQIHTNTNQSQMTSTVTDAKMFTKHAEHSSTEEEPTPIKQDSEAIKKGVKHFKNKDSNATIQMEQGIIVDINSQEHTVIPLGEVRQQDNQFHQTTSIQRPEIKTTFHIQDQANLGARTSYRNNGLQTANPTDDKILVSNGDGSVTQNTVPYIDNQSKGIHQERLEYNDIGSSEQTTGQIIIPVDEEDLELDGIKQKQMRFTVVQFGDKSIIDGSRTQKKPQPKTPENSSFVRRTIAAAQIQIYEEEEPSATTEITQIRQKEKKTAN